VIARELRASGIAHRRTEDKRAEAFFPLRATTTAADQSAMGEQLKNLQPPALTTRINQERAAAGSSEDGSWPFAASCPIECSSVGGLVLRMKNASTSDAMLITAATANAV
jgi:hypothetical protein